MKRIFVTGSTGFIGKHLITNLLNEKKKIFVIIRKSKKNFLHASKLRKKYKNYFPVFFKKNYELKSKINNINPDVVLNLATNYLPFPNNERILSVIDSNIVFPTLIINILSKNKSMKIINLCSVMQCDKNQIDNPLNFYALTKILFKKTLSYYKKFYPKNVFINLYIGDTYGSEDKRKKILPIIIKNYKKNKTTKILTKNLKLNILHVNDVINGIKFLIDKHYKSDDFYIKSNKKLDLNNVIRKFNSNTKRKVKIKFANKKISSMVNIKIKKIPKWTQKFNVIKYFYKDLNESC